MVHSQQIITKINQYEIFQSTDSFKRCRSVIWIILVIGWEWTKIYHILTRGNFAPNSKISITQYLKITILNISSFLLSEKTGLPVTKIINSTIAKYSPSTLIYLSFICRHTPLDIQTDIKRHVRTDRQKEAYADRQKDRDM